MYEYGIGEFFFLYGRFEGHYGVQGAATKDKMTSFIGGDIKQMRPYRERGQERMVPLPYAVRNILAHAAHNPNSLDAEGNDLRASVVLLRKWTRRSHK